MTKKRGNGNKRTHRGTDVEKTRAAALMLFPGGLAAPSNWTDLRREVLARDDHCCVHCKAPDRASILRVSHAGLERYIILNTMLAYDSNTGEFVGRVIPDTIPVGKSSRVVLDIAFLDGNPGNVGRKGNRPNVLSLCQQCHRQVGLATVERELQARRDAELEAENGPMLPIFG